VDGAVLGPETLALRFFDADPEAQDRLLCLNLGRDLSLPAAAEPLLAPPAGARWTLLWSSEAVRYGGSGTPELDPAAGWFLPGHAAVVLGAAR
jgi:maltooligosyltrehalose trehalohydrolase